MKLRSLALLSVSVLLLAGCGSGDSGGAAGTSTGGGSAKNDSGEKLKIVYIPKNTGNPYFNEVNKGFEDAAKDLGAEFTTSGPATADATSQIPIIKEQIQRGVDVIAISANSPDALNQVLDQARSRGITIITVDADLVGNESHRDAAVIPADLKEVGPQQVELLGKLTGYEGDFAILSATTDAPNQNAWIEKMKEALKDPKYSKMHLVETVYGDDEPQKSTTECEALLAKHPGLRGIISPTSVGLAAGAQVVERAGVYPGGAHAVGKGLQLTGLSTPNQLKKFVKNGVVTSFQLWAPYNEGYLAAQMGAQIHSGKLKPGTGATLETAKFGKQTFSDKLEIIGSPLVTFDKSNIDKYDF
jgi:rhamnose transport system substrate-binding protein